MLSMAVQASMISTDLPFRAMMFHPSMATGIENNLRVSAVVWVVNPINPSLSGSILANGK
ncbi:MAG: hypothetical protein A4E46_01315 [Methanosaeta sp. PtaU1.Bin016]|nr:MAG: hypothetical protein A4E46_01315 [Methanosaeta sp. PtaU1.Bin016]